MEIADYIILSDHDLVALSLQGDSMAFEHLFTRYRESILQLYIQRTGNREDADDLLQEIFIKVYLKLDKYDKSYTFGQWVFTIARNIFIDYIRKRKENLSIDMIQPGYGQITPASHIPNPEESIISSQQQAQLENHLERMSPRYRRLIELRFFREYSYDEIARELGIPIGTVKTQIHRAREQFCKLITFNSDMLP